VPSPKFFSLILCWVFSHHQLDRKYDGGFKSKGRFYKILFFKLTGMSIGAFSWGKYQGPEDKFLKTDIIFS
jgi:hypothetical protein